MTTTTWHSELVWDEDGSEYGRVDCGCDLDEDHYEDGAPA